MRIFNVNKINVFLIALMMMIIVVCWSSEVQAAQDGDYSYTVTDGKAEITGYTGAGGVVNIPGTLGGYPVISIGERAFLFCKSLKSVTIPNSVTSIGATAFDQCSSLTSVTIPNSVTSIGDSAFFYCSSLTSVTIPNGVTSIGDSAFAYCSGLTSVTIPNSVTSIGNSAFAYCSGLTSVTIPDSVTSIGRSVFEQCSGLTSVTIPNGVTSIGDSAFAYCSGLTSVTIPNSVTSIGKIAFFDCYGLTSVTIGNSVTSIGVQAFASCSDLTSVTIPYSVASIGYAAFGFCDSLTSITVDINNIAYSSQDGVLFDKTKTELITCPGKKYGTYNIPNSVTNIGVQAFGGCSGLTSVTIPNSVTSIGDFAFEYCTNLSAAYFEGDAPSMGGDNVFYQTQPDFIVYYHADKTGFTNPWNGYPTAIFMGNIGSYILATGISLSQSSIIFEDRTSKTLIATVSPVYATYKNINWKSDNENVATVSNGIVTPKSVGTATITASTSYGTGTAQCTVEVKKIDYSLPENREKDFLRKIALLQLAGKGDNSFKAYIGKKVKDMLKDKPELKTEPMFYIAPDSTFSEQIEPIRWGKFFDYTMVGEYEIIDMTAIPGYGLVASFDAVLFKDVNGDFIIAYPGSRDLEDWINTDRRLYFGDLSRQFPNAVIFCEKTLYLADCNKNNLSLIGHSLGGALASHVSIIEGGLKADCFNDAMGYSLYASYNYLKDIQSFAGVNVTGYTSQLNTDADSINTKVIEYKNRRNYYEYGSNDYFDLVDKMLIAPHTYKKYFSNTFAWKHLLPSMLKFTESTGDFGIYYNRGSTIVSGTEIDNLTLGTNRGDRLNAAKKDTGIIIYTGDAIGGIDYVYGGISRDAIVASGKGSKVLYGKGGSDLYIIDPNLIDSRITIIDSSDSYRENLPNVFPITLNNTNPYINTDPMAKNLNFKDTILIKGSKDEINEMDINDYPIVLTKIDNEDYYCLNFGDNRSIVVKKNRDYGSPFLELRDGKGNTRDFNDEAVSLLSTQNYSLLENESSQDGYTLKSLRISGEVCVKVYDRQGVLLGEHDNSGNEIQTADYGYFYPLNTEEEKYLDIDLINGDYVLRVTSVGSIDYTIYDPEAEDTICYEKKDIDLSDGTTLIINSDFLSADDKFTLENDQIITPLIATEFILAHEVNIDKNQIDLKAGCSITVVATLSPQNIVSGAVAWAVIQPDDNMVVAGVITNEDGSATVTGISAGNAILRGVAQDGSWVYSEIPITVTQDSAPIFSAVDADGATYSSGDWTQTSQVTVTADLPVGYDELHFSGGNQGVLDDSVIIDEPGQHDISIYARNSSNGEITATVNLPVNIDYSSPIIGGVTQGSEYYIDRDVWVTDDGLLASVMVDGTTAYTADELVTGKWFTQAGNYTLNAKDCLGRMTQTDFIIKSIPDVENISIDDMLTIQSARDEFESRKYELPTERREELELSISEAEEALTDLLMQAGISTTLDSVAITNPADKLDYFVGEPLDITGLVITGTYSDNSTKAEIVSIEDVTGFDSSVPAVDQTLTLTVGGKIATYNVQIVALDYTYSVIADNVQITGYIGAGGNVTIPSTMGGYSVSSIGESAFANCISLIAITIPDSVTEIGEYAFSGCSSLTSIGIPSSVAVIGADVFNDSTNLTIYGTANSYAQSYAIAHGITFKINPTGIITNFIMDRDGQKIIVSLGGVNGYAFAYSTQNELYQYLKGSRAYPVVYGIQSGDKYMLMGGLGGYAMNFSLYPTPIAAMENTTDISIETLQTYYIFGGFDAEGNVILTPWTN